MEDLTLHSDITKLSSRVSSVETDIQNLTHTVGRMADSIDKLAIRVGDSAKTPWATLGTWAAVIVTMLGGLGYMALTPVQILLGDLGQKFYEHQHQDGHTGMTKETEALRQDYKETKQRLRHQDTYLQREMRDLDSGIKNELDQKIIGIDTVLQREMRLIDAATKERLKALEKVVDEIKAEQRRRTDKVYSSGSKKQ